MYREYDAGSEGSQCGYSEERRARVSATRALGDHCSILHETGHELLLPLGDHISFLSRAR